MPIYPLPQFEADLALDRTEREAYERLSTPKTVVVRFGVMKMVGEFPFTLNVKPGCGTKMVARTHRGTELAEMLTSTCPNAGCSKSVTRKEMLEYIENSGGKDYPYFTDGAILRIATTDDLNEQRRVEGLKPAMKRFAQQAADAQGLKMKVVDAEPILGGERLTFYYTSEDRVDFRELVHVLSREYPARIEMRQVGARDEARLIADYEKCGQHCCCKQFLKVLKPISMKSAKIQKATLDPLKISGRCGRLMCCLRYEDETYDTLRKRLPRMKSRVMTPEGPGTVIDAQILTQLVLVELDADGKRVAVPVENLGTDAPPAPAPVRPPGDAMGRGPGGPAGGGGGGGGRGGRPTPGGEQGGSRRPMPGPTPSQSDASDGRGGGLGREPMDDDPLRGMSADEIERRLGGPGASEARGGERAHGGRDGGPEGGPDAGRDGGRRGGPMERQRSFRDRGREGARRSDGGGGDGGDVRGSGPRSGPDGRGPRDGLERRSGPSGPPQPPRPHQGPASPRPDHPRAEEQTDGNDAPSHGDGGVPPSMGTSGEPGGGKRRRRRRRGSRGGGGGGRASDGGGGAPRGGNGPAGAA